MYGKLIDGNIQEFENPLKLMDRVIFNPSAKILVENGYKEIVEIPYTETVEIDELLTYDIVETETQIQKVWKKEKKTEDVLGQIKEEKLQEITLTREQKMSYGFIYKDELYGFSKTDEENLSQTNLMLLNMLASGVEDPQILYKPKEVVSMRLYNKEDIFGVVQAAAEHKTNIWVRFNQLCIELDGATTIEEVKKIAW